MPFAIDVSVDAKRTLAQMDRLKRDQFPFALALALTQVAKDGQVAVQLHTRLAFKLRSKFVPGGVRIKPAQKADVRRYGLATSDVHTAERISGFMPVHEVGGTRTPVAKGRGRDRGKAIAIPARDLESRNFRTSTGKIRKRWAPATLLKNYGKMPRAGTGRKVVKVSRGGRKGTPFIIRGKGSGVPMIVRRRGKSKYPLELLYIFSERATYRPTWDFADEVEKAVRRDFANRLERAMHQAITTIT